MMASVEAPEQPSGEEWPVGCWPNREQLLLLKACFHPDDSLARAAFDEWTRTVPLYFVDAGSRKLLLLLYERLRAWNISTAELDPLKGVVRYYLVRHRTVEAVLPAILRTLNRAGIPSLLLKGAALNAVVYPRGQRLMADLDVAVPRADVSRALDALRADGWGSDANDPLQLLDMSHACQLESAGIGKLDLHWELFHARRLTSSDQADIWAAAERVTVGGEATHVLCPADQLLYICEHGLRFNSVAPLRWLADAQAVIKKAGNTLDWARLIKMARWHGLVAPLEQSLAYLRRVLQVEVPEDFLVSLQACKVSRLQRLGYGIETRAFPACHELWRQFPQCVVGFLRMNGLRRIGSFPDYLARMNNLPLPAGGTLLYFIRLQLHSWMSAALAWVKERVSLARTGVVYPVHRVPIYHLEGVYPPEITAFGLVCWTQTTAAIQIPALPTPCRITVHLARIRPWHGDLEQSLVVRLNRTPIPRSALAVHERADLEISFVVEPAMGMNYPRHRVELRCARWKEAPHEPRDLGLLLRSVRVG